MNKKRAFQAPMKCRPFREQRDEAYVSYFTPLLQKTRDAGIRKQNALVL